MLAGSLSRAADSCCHSALQLTQQCPLLLLCFCTTQALRLSAFLSCTQNLIMYGTFKLAQRQPGGDKMVGFTRILHRTTDDALSPLIPTFRADPLHPGAHTCVCGLAPCAAGCAGLWAAWPFAQLYDSGSSSRPVPQPCLIAECDGWCEYPVADRPNAVRQFLDAAKRDPSLIKVC